MKRRQKKEEKAGRRPVAARPHHLVLPMEKRLAAAIERAEGAIKSIQALLSELRNARRRESVRTAYSTVVDLGTDAPKLAPKPWEKVRSANLPAHAYHQSLPAYLRAKRVAPKK